MLRRLKGLLVAVLLATGLLAGLSQPASAQVYFNLNTGYPVYRSYPAYSYPVYYNSYPSYYYVRHRGHWHYHWDDD